MGESCIGNYSEVEAQAWQHCSINQSAADSGDDDCGGTFHAFYTLSRTADTKIELVAGKETQSGAPKLILLTASAARYSELAVDLVEPGIAWQQWSLDGGGDVPLPAAAIQILGQVLTASATNENVGKTLVTMKPGSSQAITPVISYPLNQNYYSFDVKATDVDLQLAMDNNRDGDITFDGADQTSAEKSYRFWVNDDQDYTASLAGNNAISGLEETVPVLTPDYSRNEIKTIRDLEDFTRLNILVQGITNELADGTFRVGVKWKHTTGTPALKLFRNLSPDGGPEYLTDVGVAQQFLDLSNPGSVAGTETYLIPTSFWQWAGINTTNNQGALIFEGCSAGKGELVLTINKPDGTELAEVGSAWLELKNIKELYQRGEEPGLNQWPSVTFDPDPNEGKEAIVFVHGWRMSPEGASEFAETMFKRLWQRGYKGRFAAFRWNTHWNGIDFGWVPYVGGGINAYLADFNGSESNAWAAGAALKNFVDTLPAGYTKNIAAHSMGNIVAGSALLSGMTIDNYALLQAAVPACSYDDSAEMQQNQPYFHYGTILVWDGLSRPDFDSDPATRALSYRGRLANVQGNLVNFALTNDYATFDAWEVNNEITKPLGPMSGDYYYYPQNPVGERLFYQKTAGGITYTRYMSNPFEAMPYACRAWSKAAGAELNTHGAISSTVDLSSPAYNLPGQPNDTGFYKEHSAEFNYPIQNLKQFYTELLRQLNVNFNP